MTPTEIYASALSATSEFYLTQQNAKEPLGLAEFLGTTDTIFRRMMSVSESVTPPGATPAAEPAAEPAEKKKRTPKAEPEAVVPAASVAVAPATVEKEAKEPDADNGLLYERDVVPLASRLHQLSPDALTSLLTEKFGGMMVKMLAKKDWPVFITAAKGKIASLTPSAGTPTPAQEELW